MICKYCQTEHPPDQIANPHYCIARLEEQIEERDREIAGLNTKLNSLRDDLSGRNAILNNLLQVEHKKLSHLTALLDDDERAEKVVNTKPYWNNSYILGRIEAINDYRAMLKKKI